MLVCNMINVNKIVDWLKQSSDWTSQLNHILILIHEIRIYDIIMHL